MKGESSSWGTVPLTKRSSARWLESGMLVGGRSEIRFVSSGGRSKDALEQMGVGSSSCLGNSRQLGDSGCLPRDDTDIGCVK